LSGRIAYFNSRLELAGMAGEQAVERKAVLAFPSELVFDGHSVQRGDGGASNRHFRVNLDLDQRDESSRCSVVSGLDNDDALIAGYFSSELRAAAILTSSRIRTEEDR
jgi:hypothetical protein